MTSHIQALLLALFACSITHDGWTSLATQSYCAITVHFITKEWELKSLCLEVKELQESHTAENLAKSLREAQQKWQFPDPVAVTDNAANEVKAMSILKWDRISCFGHNLNLAVKAALTVPEINDVLVKCRKLAYYFKMSAVAAGVLRTKQKQLTPEKRIKNVIRDVPTRWNSTYDMLERISELTGALHSTLSAPNVKSSNTKYLFTTEDAQNVEAVLKLLKPLKMQR